MTHDSERKVAIITGGAGGIGREIALRLARQNVFVALVDRNAEGADAVRQEISAAGGSASSHTVDVRDHDAIQKTVREIADKHGRLDILVNNAGGSRPASFLETTLELWQDMIAVNLTACFLFAREAAPHMQAHGGRIINMSSHSALLGSTDRGAYAAAKGGLVSLTRVMAVELAQFDITVNVIAPGPIDVQRTTGAGTQARHQAWLDALPIKRRGKPADVAGLAVFLASDDASYITGQVIPVDGGFTAAGLIT